MSNDNNQAKLLMEDKKNKPLCCKCKGENYRISGDIHWMKRYDLPITKCLGEAWICGTCLMIDICVQILDLEDNLPGIAKKMFAYALKIKETREK